jgi:molybdenum-dependent DNA-binding transcriptional regulator ModE
VPRRPRGGRADQAAALDHLGAALLAEVVAAQGAALAVLAVAGGDAQARVDEALGLAQLGAGEFR